MIRLMRRLTREFRTRGASGFLRFIGSRLLHRRSDVLYELDLESLRSSSSEMPGTVTVNCHNLGTEEVHQVELAVLTEANHAYREALAGDAQLFALTAPNRHVLAYGFVLFDSFYKRVLGEASGVPMISNCFTFAENRGQGLYPRLLRSICHELAAQGYRRTIITCAPDNLASVRGIEKAHFHQVRTVHSIVFLARWIAFQRIEPNTDSQRD